MASRVRLVGDTLCVRVCVACIAINQLNCPIICNRKMLKCIFKQIVQQQLQKVSAYYEEKKTIQFIERQMHASHMTEKTQQSVQERNKLSTSKMN